MGLDGESEESLERYARERGEGYVDGEPVGMDPTVPGEAGVELDEMRKRTAPKGPEYIGMQFSLDFILVDWLGFLSNNRIAY